MSQIRLSYTFAPKTADCAGNNHIVLLETVNCFKGNSFYFSPETTLSSSHAIILHISYVGFEMKKQADKLRFIITQDGNWIRG